MSNNWSNYINREFGTRIISKWVVFIFDIVITLFTYGVAYTLRYNFNTSAVSFDVFIEDIILTILVYAISFLSFKSYDGIIRHSGVADALRIIKAGLMAIIILIVLSTISKVYDFSFGITPIAIAIIHLVINVSILVFSRYGIKVFFYEVNRNKISKIPVAIYGAGRRGLSVFQAIKNDSESNFVVAAFLDDNDTKLNKTIEGVKIFSPKKMEAVIHRYQIQQLIIGIHEIEPQKKNDIVAICFEHQVSVKSVPPVANWINGQLSLKQLKNINIEDLLGREPILLENEQIHQTLSGKRIMVTGAAGSIGSELVKQIIKYAPKQLILIDQAESPLFDLKMDLLFAEQLRLHTQVAFIVCDITNQSRLEKIFATYHPEMIFHAAAYKHVPLMEDNVYEAVDVNIFGSKNLIDLAIKHKVEKFVMISTDKAVNPTNVMGATKRAAEVYVQYKSKLSPSNPVFITTRFGNVLGSNGSVVNYFSKQIAQGGPLTITYPEVTRYFMTISEACQLVLEAATMGKTSELYLFDMGNPVKIIDLARKMVLLSGLEPETDIPFVYTGLRPGEKLHEELLNTNENTLPTHHHKIKVALTAEYSPEIVESYITSLQNALKSGDTTDIVTALKHMIPEFISQNSDFEHLDATKSDKLPVTN